MFLDNGGQVVQGGNKSPLRGWKYSLWEGGVRANGFLYSAKLQKPGEVRTGLMHVTDWFPTLIHLGGGNTDGLNLDGYNQWEALR